MEKYRITKVYETYYDAYVEAESLEEALKKSEDAETEWEEDNDTRFLARTTWSLLDEDGDTLEDGVIDNN